MQLEIRQIILFYAATGLSKQNGANFWTSGFTDKVCNNWCTNKDGNEIISQTTNWLQKTPTNPLVDKCVIVEFSDGDASKSGLMFADCSSKTEFICEVIQQIPILIMS
jgi:hypothetical protein